jgi:hypothetical protein
MWDRLGQIALDVRVGAALALEGPRSLHHARHARDAGAPGVLHLQVTGVAAVEGLQPAEADVGEGAGLEVGVESAAPP